MTADINVLEAYRTWTPTQRELFAELVMMASAMHYRGESEDKILKAIKRRTKQFQKKLAR